MAKRIAVSTLNASTVDILNVIRQNASLEYQQNVPVVTKVTDIPKVGEVICGTPAFSNAFINALVNRIALVVVQSATFNNPYTRLKKGYLDFGETIEEIFVQIAKVYEYSAEKAESREFKRSIPDVLSNFHAVNWRVVYPVTIQDEDLTAAFLSTEGVQGLIAKIVDSVYKAAEYDEFLLTKYLIVKAISHGKMYPISIGTGADPKEAAVAFRGYSNNLTFMKREYNEANVLTNTPKNRQVIFMDSMYNASYDVNVLASAFNMEKADFMGSLFLIDDFTTFDNDRFSVIRENSDGLEEVTAEELALLANVKAVLLDENWFQIYDNKNKFTEKYVSSGMYWNYFYHVWKVISHSMFSNAIVFVTDSATITEPASFTVEIVDKDTSEEATTFALSASLDGASLEPNNVIFIQTQTATAAGIGIQPYGAVLIPASASATELTLEATINGVKYTGATSISSANNVGSTVTMNKA